MIDLHLHLDGSLSKRCVRKIIKENGLEMLSDEKLTQGMIYNPTTGGSLVDYLKCFDMPLSFLQSPENVRFAVMTLLEDLYREGVNYTEIRFAPILHTKGGYTAEDILRGAIEGLYYGDIMGINAKLILCMMRGFSSEENELTVELARKYIGAGVCAIDLAGDEAGYPVEIYSDLFKYAKDSEIPFTIHAGEAAGAESVEKAIELGARRIGHGIRAIDDELLMKYIAKEEISLELCPTSNLQTGACKAIEEYPIVEFIKRGIRATVNTDNRTVSNTNLKSEFELIKKVPGYDIAMEKVLINNAILSKF